MPCDPLTGCTGDRTVQDMVGLSVNLIAKNADRPQLAAIVCCRCPCELVVWDTNFPVEIGL